MNIDMLNNEQKAAVLHTEGPLLILAGAGSGKTRVLTHRIAHLIEEKHIFPSNILAITFTNKAASEMKNRIESLIGNASEGIWMGTFHSVCVKILRRDAEKLGYTRDFAIFDPYDQRSLMKEIYKELRIDDKKNPYKMMLSKISEAKNELVLPDEYEGVYGSDYIHELIVKCYRLYQRKLKTYNAMDFDDLIGKAIELLKGNPEILEFYRNKFRYIHVDEYQDTNKAQYLLVNMFAGARKNLCVVGDNDQSIYGWRGADVRNIRDFEKDFLGAKVIKLEQNYRSFQNILRAANSVIKNNPGRNEKNLWSDKDHGELIRYFCANNEYEEARFVASQIITQKIKERRKLSDFAVLYRTNAQSRVLEDAFRKENINYRLVGGLRFYERKEIKDLLSYFRLINNLTDDISFLRVVNTPKRGLGDKSIEKIREIAGTREISIFDACKEAIEGGALPKAACNGLQGFIRLIDDMVQTKDEIGITGVFKQVVERTSYIELLRSEDTRESMSRIENLDELASAVIQYEKKNGISGSLSGFLEENTLKSDIDGLSDDEDGVVMMTLHTAKGLEFPVVFITGLEEKTFPTSRAIENVMSDEGLEEERRLAYVGITRAEELLYLTHARTRNMYGNVNYYEPSRFIREIEKELMENVGDEQGIFRSQPKLGTTSSGPVSLSLDQMVMSQRKRDISIKQTSNSAQSLEPSSYDSVKAGVKVQHGTFGFGTVISTTGDGDDKVVTIAFASKGIKKLKLSFAGLKIV